MDILMKTNNLDDLAMLIQFAKRLNVQVIENPNKKTEDENWNEVALASLQKAYSDDEPEYDITQVKVFNPNFNPST